jgi:signal transduction histidine kinase
MTASTLSAPASVLHHPPVGSGFGLGLFLARTFAERWGGSLQLSSAPGDGTTATMLLPPAGTEGHPA